MLNFKGPDFGGDVVEGEEVDMGRFCCDELLSKAAWGTRVVKGRRCKGGGTGDIKLDVDDVRTCVCTRVLTTSIATPRLARRRAKMG